MTYNVTPITQNVSFAETLTVINSFTDDRFGIYFLIAIFLISLMSTLFSQVRPSASFMVSSTITLFLAFILRWLELINDLAFFVVVIVFVISLIAIFYDQ